MPKLPRLTAVEAERKLKAAGFILIRSKGSHPFTFGNSNAWSYLFIAARSFTRKLCTRSC